MIYFLIGKAIQVDNFNLGVVSFGVLFLICMSFYLKPEPSYFVWVHADSPDSFLKRKLGWAFICATTMTVPALLSLIVFFPDYLIISIVVAVVGYIYLSSMVFAKYSAFPKEINVPQGIMYVISLWFPPLLLLVIPIFYKKAKRNLEQIL